MFEGGAQAESNGMASSMAVRVCATRERVGGYVLFVVSLERARSTALS